MKKLIKNNNNIFLIIIVAKCNKILKSKILNLNKKNFTLINTKWFSINNQKILQTPFLIAECGVTDLHLIKCYIYQYLIQNLLSKQNINSYSEYLIYCFFLL